MKNFSRNMMLLLPVLVCLVTVALIHFILTHRENVQVNADEISYEVTTPITGVKNIIPIVNPELDADIEQSKVINKDIESSLKTIDKHVKETKVFINVVKKDNAYIIKEVEDADVALKTSIARH